MGIVCLETGDELLLKSFVESRLPRFYQEVGLACSAVEYLVGLSCRCLHGDAHLTFELGLDEGFWGELDGAIENHRDDYLSRIFRLQMEAAYLVLVKYYNPDGSARDVR
jgi:hypothetical protein